MTDQEPQLTGPAPFSRWRRPCWLEEANQAGVQQTLIKEAESNQYSALHLVRMRYNQTKYLLADAMDSIDDYITSTVWFSKRRLMMMERLQVAYVGFAGNDEAISMTTEWSGAEDEAIVSLMEELQIKFDTAANKMLEINDAVDTRLMYIDELASELAKEKIKWKKDLRSVSKAQSGNTASFGKLAGASEDMIGALSRLEVGIGAFTDDLDVWTTHSKDVWTPTLLELMRSFATLSRNDFGEVNKEAIRLLMAMQNEVSGTRFQSLTKKGNGGKFEWPKLRIILTSPLLKLYYKTYLSQAHNLENLLFVESVETYRQKCADLPNHSSKGLAVAKPIVELYVVEGARHQINIRAAAREQTLKNVAKNLTISSFDVAYEEVMSMMDRDATLNFKHSALGQDMIRRLSHCRIESDLSRILQPSAKVSLQVLAVDMDAPEEEASNARESISSSSDGLKPKRRLGSFTLRKQRSAQSDLAPSDGPMLSPGSERLKKESFVGALISPRRRTSSGTAIRRGSVLAASSLVVPSSVTPPTSPQSILSSGSPIDASENRPLSPKSPKNTLPPIKLVETRPATPPVEAKSLEDALARSPRPSPRLVIDMAEESALSPRDMLRGDPEPSPKDAKDAPTPKTPRSGRGGGPKRISPRSKESKLRHAGTSTKQKIPM